VSRARLAGLAGALALAACGECAAQGYVDPRVSMSGYQQWCARQGGTLDLSGGVGCRVGAGSLGGGAGGGAAAGQALGQALAPLFYQFGQMLGCAMIGGCDSPQAVDQAGQRAARMNAEFEAAQAERLRREQESRRKFQDAQGRMVGEMHGSDFDGSVSMHELGAGGDAQVREREYSASGLGPEGRARCAVFLLYKANKATVEINTQSALWEAAYLGNEAAGIAGSAGYRPRVECPRGAPEPSGAPAADAALQLRRIQHAAVSFARLQQQIADLESQKAALENTRARVAESNAAADRTLLRRQQQQVKDMQRSLDRAASQLRQEMKSLGNASAPAQRG